MRPISSEAGFTMLELLIAVAILSILVVVQVAPFQQTIESRDHAEAAVQASSAARITLLRLSEELSGALGLANARGRFALTAENLDRPSSTLRFATTGARRVHGGARDPIDLVRYFLERDPNGTDSFRLMKQQLPSIAAEGVEPIEMVVLDNVAAFQAEVLTRRGGQWVTEWQPEDDAIPRAVRLVLATNDGIGPPTSYRTTVTVPMGDQSS